MHEHARVLLEPPTAADRRWGVAEMRSLVAHGREDGERAVLRHLAELSSAPPSVLFALHLVALDVVRRGGADWYGPSLLCEADVPERDAEVLVRPGPGAGAGAAAATTGSGGDGRPTDLEVAVAHLAVCHPRVRGRAAVYLREHQGADDHGATGDATGDRAAPVDGAVDEGPLALTSLRGAGPVRRAAGLTGRTRVEGLRDVGPHHGGPHRDGPHHDGPHHDGPHHDGPHHDGPHDDGPHDDVVALAEVVGALVEASARVHGVLREVERQLHSLDADGWGARQELAGRNASWGRLVAWAGEVGRSDLLPPDVGQRDVGQRDVDQPDVAHSALDHSDVDRPGTGRGLVGGQAAPRDVAQPWVRLVARGR